MSGRNGSGLKLDLNLNLPPPTIVNQGLESSARSAIVSLTSSSYSCLSTELNQDDNNNNNNNHGYSNISEAISIVLVGCPHCLMYVMINEGDLKCPKCKSSTLIHFLNENNIP
ncbi:hypothetical protein AAZX31_02G186400 [Glycine max]|uniref:GIR1-like zinc ribbon domain-containing protein n=2 Tax=Glycine subgen. Soja TaxID=1462606 RepID=I1JGK8_SOYBN|nr:protein GL2-INTERACTING REPRESSOR 1 [Glycine max]KAG5052484.1 hypothetical protein JHK87_004682 [Glycine soja]KAG5063840.1 hypothetical protein JHK85_005023 [Glycine max]KAG5080793.1 hypothetical protein JHK86_004858 [Glycine max]KAH1061219.1 hypothetical protein GYH30_004629 [Glycine max]KAH1262612.1 hypothetical protein GmHk_02G005193 [Glycine max]|eukprot:XP_025983124.1 uncharacterized protein LOC106797939 [Glycine max]